MKIIISVIIGILIITNICVAISLLKYVQKYESNNIGVPVKGISFRAVLMLGITTIIGILSIVVQLL